MVFLRERFEAPRQIETHFGNMAILTEEARGLRPYDLASRKRKEGATVNGIYKELELAVRDPHASRKTVIDRLNGRTMNPRGEIVPAEQINTLLDAYSQLARISSTERQAARWIAKDLELVVGVQRAVTEQMRGKAGQQVISAVNENMYNHLSELLDIAAELKRRQVRLSSEVITEVADFARGFAERALPRERVPFALKDIGDTLEQVLEKKAERDFVVAGGSDGKEVVEGLRDDLKEQEAARAQGRRPFSRRPDFFVMGGSDGKDTVNGIRADAGDVLEADSDRLTRRNNTRRYRAGYRNSSRERTVAPTERGIVAGQAQRSARPVWSSQDGLVAKSYDPAFVEAHTPVKDEPSKKAEKARSRKKAPRTATLDGFEHVDTTNGQNGKNGKAEHNGHNGNSAKAEHNGNGSGNGRTQRRRGKTDTHVHLHIS